LSGTVLTLLMFSFFRVKEEKASVLVLTGLESAEGFVVGIEGFVSGAIFVNFSSNSCFFLTN
jgi:hypothetical protein